MWKCPPREKTLEEKNTILRAKDLKAMRCCEIIWSGLSITVPSAASTPTTWCKYLLWHHPISACNPSSLLWVCRKKIKKVMSETAGAVEQKSRCCYLLRQLIGMAGNHIPALLQKPCCKPTHFLTSSLAPALCFLFPIVSESQQMLIVLPWAGAGSTGTCNFLFLVWTQKPAGRVPYLLLALPLLSAKGSG